MTRSSNNIKIIISFFLSVCLLFVFFVTVMAKEHTVNEIEAKLYIPDDWYVFSKDSSIGDYPFLDEGIFDTGMKTVASEDVCLCAVSPESDSTIIINYYKNNTGFNYNSFSDKEVDQLLNNVKKELIDRKFNVTQCSIFHGTNTKYIKLLYSQPDEEIYSLQYSAATINNSINIIFSSIWDEIDDNDEEIAHSAADSLTGLSDELFEAKNISSSSSSNSFKTKFLPKIIAGVIIGGAYEIIRPVRNSSKNKSTPDPPFAKTPNAKRHMKITSAQDAEKSCPTAPLFVPNAETGFYNGTKAAITPFCGINKNLMQKSPAS